MVLNNSISKTNDFLFLELPRETRALLSDLGIASINELVIQKNYLKVILDLTKDLKSKEKLIKISKEIGINIESFTNTQDFIYDAAKLFLKLPPTSKQTLYNFNISSFKNLVSETHYVRKRMENLTRIKTKEKILEIIELIESSNSMRVVNSINSNEEIEVIQIEKESTKLSESIVKATLLFQKLPSTARKVLYSYNISSFEDMVNETHNVKALIENDNRTKSRKQILEIIKLIESSNSTPKVRSEEEIEAIQNGILNLPLLLFIDLFGMKIFKSFSSEGNYFVKDIYLKRFSNKIKYICWNKILKQNLKTNSYKKNLENEVSIGLNKFLEFNNIENLVEIEKFTSNYETFRKLPLSNRNLYEEIRNQLSKNQQSKDFLKEYKNSNLLLKVKILLNKIYMIDRGIFWARSIEGKTLEEIGNKINLTRERVRQIEKVSQAFIKPVIQNLIKLEINKEPNFEQIIMKRPILLPEQIHFIKFLGFTDIDSINILNMSEDIEIIISDKNEFILVQKNMINVPYLAISEKIKQYRCENILLESRTEDYQRVYFRLVAEGIIEQENDSREYVINFISLLWEKRFILIKDDKKIYINQKKITNLEIIETILRRNGPMHYSEIDNIIRSEYGIDINDRTVHATLTRPIGKFVNVGRGIYDISGSRYSGKTVFHLIKGFLEDKRVPQAQKDIEEYVLNQKKVNRQSVLVIISNYPKVFRRTEGGRFGLAEWNYIKYPTKITRMARFPYTKEDAFKNLLIKGQLNKPFTLDDYITLLNTNFPNKTSCSRQIIYSFLNTLKKNKKLNKLKKQYYVECK